MLTDQWINDVLHRLIPIVLLIDWSVAPPRRHSLIRGEFVDWYPYPFLDHRQHRYVSVVIGLVVLSGAMVLLALAVGALGRLATRWRYRADKHDTVD